MYIFTPSSHMLMSCTKFPGEHDLRHILIYHCFTRSSQVHIHVFTVLWAFVLNQGIGVVVTIQHHYNIPSALLVSGSGWTHWQIAVDACLVILPLVSHLPAGRLSSGLFCHLYPWQPLARLSFILSSCLFLYLLVARLPYYSLTCFSNYLLIACLPDYLFTCISTHRL